MTKLNLDLFSVQVLGATKDVALGESFTTELVNLNHFAERYQTNERVWWQQTQRHLQRLL